MNMRSLSLFDNISPADAAKTYVSLGMELMLIHPLTKKPVGNDWQTRPGITRPDHAGIMFLDPAQNIGFKPGNSFVVIDIDIKHGGKGLESWAKVNERFGPMPETVEAITASGGGLRIYRVPADAGLQFQRKMLGLPDLEFRIGPVNCILPPSKVSYPNGTVGQHRWKDGRAPGEIEFAELPKVVVEAVRAFEPETPAISGGGAVAEYLSAEFKAQLAANPRPAEFAPIREGCAFIKRADERPADLSEEEWYAVLSVTSRCRDGENISHVISARYPGYDKEETTQKMMQAHRASGPRSCTNIKNKIAFKGCERCPFWGRIKGPYNLGQLPPKPRDPRTKEVTGYDLLQRVKLQTNMIYDAETDRVFLPASGAVLKAKAFGTMVRDKVGKNTIDTLLGWAATPRAAQFDYLPGDTRLMVEKENDLPWCNTWLAGGAVAHDDAEAAKRVMLHFEMLFPDDLTRKHVLDYFAHLVQKPGIKIKSALIITGDEGYGKSTIGTILEALFGARNVQKVGGKELSGRFKDRMVNRQVVVVEEANHGERFEVTEELKDWFTAEWFGVEGKNIPFHDGRTPRGVIIYSNHDAPLVIGPGSRRFFVGATTRKLETDAYFANIYATIEDVVAMGAFKHALLTRDISSFKPHAEPPRTGARDAAEEASRTPLGRVIARMIEEQSGPFYRDIVLMREVEEALRLPHMAGVVGSVETGKVVAAMKQVGARKVGVSHGGEHRLISLPNGLKVRLWAIRNMRDYLNAPDSTLKVEVMRAPADRSNITPMKQATGQEEAVQAKAG
ncbi:bifunctional DNA primase/polymerase [Methylobacterium sp. CM6241]